MVPDKGTPVKLFWTGGWDSTYRLLELVIFRKTRVQPVYIIDPDRNSVRYEMRAMQKIKMWLQENYPAKRELLLPTMFFELCDIKPDAEISNLYRRIVEKYPELYLGIQNEWMVRLMNQYGLSGVEMGLQRSISSFFTTFMNLLEEQKVGGRSVVRVKEELKGKDEYEFFKNFHFALTEITKPEMFQKVVNEGFIDIMEQTWFCHNPTPSGKPCGVCVPCYAVMKEGMSHRLPASAKVRYHLRIFLSREQLKRKYPRVHRLLSRAKRFIF